MEINYAQTRERSKNGRFIKPNIPSGFDRKIYRKREYEKNREQYIKNATEWNKNNKEKRKVTKDKWRANNKEKTNFLARLYLYRKKGAGGYPTFKQVNELYERYFGLCVYCHINKATTLDHVIPISRNGSNNIENLMPACLSCNSSKGGKLLKEWKPELYE